MLGHKNLKDALADTAYFVETCGGVFIQNALWLQYHDSADLIGYPKVDDWQEISMGFLEMVGPVTMCRFGFARLYGKRVCFYGPTSNKVDWDEINAYLEPYWSKGDEEGRRLQCNASNFGHCIIHLRRLRDLGGKK